MAGSRLKEWLAGETLTAADLNGEFDNILATSDQLIGTPRSAAWDMDGQTLIMDAGGTSSFAAGTNGKITVSLLGISDLFAFDGTVSGADSGFDFIASDLSGGNGDPSITVVSTETNCSLNIVPKGTGDLQVNGGSMSPLAWEAYGV